MGQTAAKVSDGAASLAAHLAALPVSLRTGHTGKLDGDIHGRDLFGPDARPEVTPVDVSPLASTSHAPVRLTEATLRHAPSGSTAPCSDDVQSRDWTVHSVLEVLSVSKGRWYVAYVMQVHPGEFERQLLTVRFWDEKNEAKQKNSPRDDPGLAPLGTHTSGQLPPGFQKQASQSRLGAFAFADTATGRKYTSSAIAWNVYFQRLRDGPPLAAPDAVEAADEGRPVPRRSPTAIAAGIAEDVSPLPQALRSSSALTEAADTPTERWNKAKADWEASVAVEIEGPKITARPPSAPTGGQAQRALANHAPRVCPTFSPVELDVVAPPTSVRNPAASPSCGAAAPAGIAAAPRAAQKSAPAFAAAAAAASIGGPTGKLLLDELSVGAGAFNPAQPALLEQLRHKLGCGSSQVTAIEEFGDFRGGMNEGVWFLGDYVLKLVSGARRHLSLMTEAEHFVKLYNERPDIVRDPTLAFPVAIFSCLRSGQVKSHDLIVMRSVPGKKLATLIAFLWHDGEQSKLWQLLARVGAYLASFQARYGSNMCHGDFHPSNIFYDETTDQVFVIDLGGLGPVGGETDAEHFESSLRLLAQNYNKAFEIEGIRSFRTGYISGNAVGNTHEIKSMQLL